MDYYDKIIDSLSITFSKADKYILRQPICINDYQNENNTLILLHNGSMSFGYRDEAIKAGELFFIPAGTKISMTYGEAISSQNITQDKFLKEKDKYLAKWTPKSRARTKTYFSKITFNARIFESINFIKALEIPNFILTNHFIISNLVNQLFSETIEERLGAKRLISAYTEQIMIEIIRHLLDNKMFIEAFATNETHFQDVRLARIVEYIRNGTVGRLTSQNLGEAAGMSKKYVGEYFKTMTGMRTQDFVEYKRMQKAVELLKNTKLSIEIVANRSGYADTAYFCRRFKTMYGIPPGKLRQRRSKENDLNY